MKRSSQDSSLQLVVHDSAMRLRSTTNERRMFRTMLLWVSKDTIRLLLFSHDHLYKVCVFCDMQVLFCRTSFSCNFVRKF